MWSHARLDPTALRLLKLALLLGVVPAVLALTLGVVIAMSVEESFGDLVRDLTVTTESPLYLGALSTLTGVVWTAGAAIALATAIPARRSGPLAVLLLMCGLLTLAFALDDQFLVHDGVLQVIGLSGDLALIAYVLWGAVTIIWHRGLLRSRPETPVLAVGAMLLAGSLIVDLTVEKLDLDLYDSARILAEDGLKLIGAAVWAVGLGALARAVQAATRDTHVPDQV